MVSVIRSGSVGTGQAVQRRPWEPLGRVDVERLAHWAYADQLVERFASVGLHAIEAQAAGFAPHGRSACGVARLIEIGNLGCEIDGGGTVRDAVHPAAYAVERCVRTLGKDAAATVKHHARSGRRPTQWQPPERLVRPAFYAADGKSAQVEYQGPGRAGAFCSIIIVWDTVRADWGREQYRLWWDGLAELAWQLSLLNLGFTVDAPAIAREPWA